MSKKNKSNVKEQKTNLDAEVQNEEAVVNSKPTDADKKKQDKKANKNAKKKAPKEKGKLKRKAKETISEIKKVTWPSFGEVCKRTGVVLVVVIIFAVVVFGIDTGLGALAQLLRGAIAG